ncbi:MAG: class I SAM-dependent methyltransferase [Planctomycetota bacterium]
MATADTNSVQPSASGGETKLTSGFRGRRFEVFKALVEPMHRGLDRPLEVLDVGGTEHYWEQRGWAGRDDIRITLLNLEAAQTSASNISSTKGDATKMPEIGDASYDIAHSNSVIEHLFTWDAQRAMAGEIARVGRAHWVQTPNFWFPMEPHFRWIGWQWMPRGMRIGLLRRVRCGMRGPVKDKDAAAKLIDEVRLMTRREMGECFPGSTLWAERLGPFVKSWVAYGGFPGG